MENWRLFKLQYEKPIIILLFIIALVRLFVFSSAFPFFNNIDEQMHFDLVVKYARGYVLGKDTSRLYDRESVAYIARFGSPEYFRPAGFNKTPEIEATISNAYSTSENHEIHSPPLYYALAGLWYNAGKCLGIDGGYLLYWIRFLNLPIYGVLLWIAYLFCRFIDPNDVNLRLGTILLLAFIPQDVFYSINSDVLSPLCFLISLFMLIKIYASDRSLWFHGITGFMVAATVLVKLSNLPVLVVFFIMFIALTMKYRATKQGAARLPHLFTLLASASIPLIVWGGFNYYYLGDVTGTASKIDALGWQVKPFGQIWDHPIFTVNGGYYFISNLIKTFWRGEFVWHLERIKSEGADILYATSSVIFYLIGLKAILMKKASPPAWQRLPYAVVAVVPLLFFFYLAFLSIRYDFGDCQYPSKELPYFVSGRLILASLIPFLSVYVKGAESITAKISQRIDPVVIIAVIALYSLYSEIAITLERGVFVSPFNFFHL